MVQSMALTEPEGQIEGVQSAVEHMGFPEIREYLNQLISDRR